MRSYLVTAAAFALLAAGCGLETAGLLANEAATNNDGGGTAPLVDAGLAPDSTPAQSAPDAGDGSVAIAPDSGGGTPEDAAITTGGNDAGIWDDDAGDANSPVELDAGADAQCTGASWTCTPGPVPSGWRIVEYVESNRPTCSDGYGSPVDVVEGPSASDANCACACDLTTPGSCESGSYTVSYNAGGAPMCTAGSANVATNGGACTAVTAFTLNAGSKLQVAPAPFTPGSCTPAPTQTLPPVQYAGEGEVCNPTSVSSAACANGGVCAPTAKGMGFSLCIVASGAQTCPAGFPHSHQTSTGITDSRGCSACTCGPDTAGCTAPAQTIFPAAGCASGGISIPANDACVGVPMQMNSGDGGNSYVAIQYSAQVQNEGCAPSSVTATGGVTLASVHTVCCQ